MPGPRLSLTNVTRRFGRAVAVDDATVRFEPGVIHAVVGENGAGKSTLLKMAAGALAPSSGAVAVDDRPLQPATTARVDRGGAPGRRARALGGAARRTTSRRSSKVHVGYDGMFDND